MLRFHEVLQVLYFFGPAYLANMSPVLGGLLQDPKNMMLFKLPERLFEVGCKQRNQLFRSRDDQGKIFKSKPFPAGRNHAVFGTGG